MTSLADNVRAASDKARRRRKRQQLPPWWQAFSLAASGVAVVVLFFTIVAGPDNTGQKATAPTFSDTNQIGLDTGEQTASTTTPQDSGAPTTTPDTTIPPSTTPPATDTPTTAPPATTTPTTAPEQTMPLVSVGGEPVDVPVDAVNRAIAVVQTRSPGATVMQIAVADSKNDRWTFQMTVDTDGAGPGNVTSAEVTVRRSGDTWVADA
jgi:cytoskeletal protein RodZ